MKKALAVAAVVFVGIIALGMTAHAAAGPIPHEGLDCIACALCEWLAGALH